MEKTKSCWNCHECVHFKKFDGRHQLFCMMAKTFIPMELAMNDYIVECEFYRDNLYDHVRMDLGVQENNPLVPRKE